MTYTSPIADFSEQHINRLIMSGEAGPVAARLHKKARRRMARDIRKQARRASGGVGAYEKRQTRDLQRGYDRRALRVLANSTEMIPSTNIPKKRTWRDSLRAVVGR